MKKAAAVLCVVLVGIAMACSPVKTTSGGAGLDGRWELQKIGDTVIRKTNYPSGLPVLAFDLKQGRVSGFGGCNRFLGSCIIAGNTISFGSLAATKMACSGPNVEDRYLRALSNKKQAYRLEDGQLFLGEGNDRLVFKRAN